MKYLIAILLLLVMSVALTRQINHRHLIDKEKTISIADSASQRAIPHIDGQVETKGSRNQSKLMKVSDELEQLNQKLEVLDKELENAGYPKVMLSDNLTESERNQIINKLLAASRLHERISLLTLKKIDLEVEL